MAHPFAVIGTARRAAAMQLAIPWKHVAGLEPTNPVGGWAMSPLLCRRRPACLWGPDPAAPPRWHTEPAGAAAVRPLTAGRPPANWVLHRRSSAAEFGGPGGPGRSAVKGRAGLSRTRAPSGRRSESYRGPCLSDLPDRREVGCGRRLPYDDVRVGETLPPAIGPALGSAERSS